LANKTQSVGIGAACSPNRAKFARYANHSIGAGHVVALVRREPALHGFDALVCAAADDAHRVF
jgi:hypothetical protein